MASAFYLMAQEKYFSFCMVPFTFVQVASKFRVVLFYLYNFFFFFFQTRRVRHRDTRWLAWNARASGGQLKLESDLS